VGSSLSRLVIWWIVFGDSRCWWWKWTELFVIELVIVICTGGRFSYGLYSTIVRDAGGVEGKNR
jgi:hypothetical protein